MPASPIGDLHERLGARFTDFGGWVMPLRYRGTIDEHMAVRRHAGVFDVSHLGRIRVSGPEAEKTLRQLLCNDIGTIEPGRAQYTMMLNRAGGIVDDIIVWKPAADSFIVMPNGVNVDDATAALAAVKGVEWEDLRPQTGFFAVQGPRAPDVLQEVTGWRPRRFGVEEVGWRGSQLTVGGTGYTGEKGGELMVPLAAAAELFQALVDAGCEPCGLGARDTLRLEMGYPLWGQDLDENSSPIEAGLGWVVNWDHDFVGKRPLVRQRRAGGGAKALIAFVMKTKHIPRSGYRIRGAGSEGLVTSGNYSPVLETGIGLAYVSPPPVLHRFSRREAAPDPPFEVEVRREWVPVELASLPFVDV
jgi:aminomethyltransferase